ncbi:type II toxin-antitoxin system YafQ family toxin [Dethiosulfovibrio sp. F2B]|nr:type II toxin-antitoxin system YafQ family toxin [Dethiosulfovibrio faecalis]
MLGNWGSHRSLHIEPDWILIYKVDQQTISLIRTGTHSDILKRKGPGRKAGSFSCLSLHLVIG